MAWYGTALELTTSSNWTHEVTRIVKLTTETCDYQCMIDYHVIKNYILHKISKA